MIFIERFEFTYQDYLNYCDSFYCDAKEEFLCVKEDSEEDVYEEKTGDQKHDKIFRDILQNKEEIAQFISNFAKYTIKSEMLEIQNSNYITQNFKYKQADIVYKTKGEEIYFLIEHQTKVDYSMAYRILNYCVEISNRRLIKRKFDACKYYDIREKQK